MMWEALVVHITSLMTDSPSVCACACISICTNEKKPPNQ